MTRLFPFSAIVGQELMKKALLLNAVNPSIGGVLIRGEKGTAKSTLARALAELLPEIEVVDGCPYSCSPANIMPDCPHCSTAGEPVPRLRRMRVVNLPANATEDRVAGSLDMEHALQHGTRRFEPGVLAEAHRGILYIDEVNLLDDHIVDLLLDAAAMGVNTVEREGLSFSHPARFLLIGTMNPEEGDLRPQLLDRFALCVDAESLMDEKDRAEIVRRRLWWEEEPGAYCARHEKHQHRIAEKIVRAKELLPSVRISDRQIARASRICIELDVRSHRADIVMARTARTIAAFDGRRRVRERDIKQAALMALPHRLRRRPFEETRLDPEQVDQALQKPEPKQQPPQPSESGGQAQQDLPHSTSQEQVFEIGSSPDVAIPEPAPLKKQAAAAGRRSKAATESTRGRAARTEIPSGRVDANNIAIDATLRAAGQDQKNPVSEGGVTIRPDHIRVKRRTRPAGTTIVFVVDASGSMAAAQRMAAAKGAVLALLRDAYVKRNRVALVTFRGNRSEVLLQPTDNVERAHGHLKELPTGGRTPLAHGLAGALELTHQIHQRNPEAHLLCVLISDGKANVPYAATPAEGVTPYEEAVDFARQLTRSHSRLIVLDTEDDFLSLGLARKLADAACADYVKLSQIEAGNIETAVRERLND